MKVGDYVVVDGTHVRRVAETRSFGALLELDYALPDGTTTVDGARCRPYRRGEGVYLAGPINGCTDEEAHGWRDRARGMIRGPCVDPMVRDYRGAEELVPARHVVDPDVRDIAGCAVVLAMCARPSWGTAMEIAIAKRELGRTVVAVCPGVVSPWISYHADLVCRTLEDACDAVNQVIFPFAVDIRFDGS